MGKNIFSMFQGYVPKPKRNVFDLSFNNNFTTKFGQLTPVLCKEVVPGDSFKIETAAGLRLMPMAFPVQTPMKAYVHYFYVRNRALWKDWQDFITGTKDNLVPPYIDVANLTEENKKEFFKVGGIADYFGVPNVLYNSESTTNVSDFAVIGANQSVTILNDDDEVVYTISYSPLTTTLWTEYNFLHYVSAVQYIQLTYSSSTSAATILQSFVSNASSYLVGTTAFSAFTNLNPNLLPEPYGAVRTYNESTDALNSIRCIPWSYLGRYNQSEGHIIENFEVTFDSSYCHTQYPYIIVTRDSNNIIQSVTGSFVEPTSSGNTRKLVIPCTTAVGNSAELYLLMPYNLSSTSDTLTISRYLTNNTNVSVSIGDSVSLNYGIVGSDYSDTPYDSDIHLNALPFRAYECIYNSYYRNMQNNPYVLNGVEEYNKFIPSNDGGADTNDYHLRQRNWEYDFMTSAVPSPQFGVAPLVGITMTGTATFQDENGTTYYAQAELDDDGTITGWSTHSSNMPAGTLRMLMDNVGTGISINDLRNVNSFQRFLENSLRVGLKYRDQIKGHFGVDVRYDELEMPEFIGGMSLDINVNQVTQTADVIDSSYPLAGFAGQAGAFGSSKHAVTKYCDEHGFIIGILSVVPVPVYSQLLPKFFIKNEMLDYYYPEFGHVGYQPILQKEISPLQSYYTNSDLNDVFGYQRAWYDYIASTDEVHSQFRTTLRDFVMNRTFENVPALNESFLLVDPDQVNDVFLVTSDGEYGPEADKILGQLYFKITKKSPIPILGIPRLTD